MSYSRKIQVEFNHCDPAGIVFYPRYFEMTNSVVENFFGEALNYPYSRITLEEGCGVPTVRIEANFMRPSRLGEVLNFDLEVRSVGGASLALQLLAEAGGEQRMAADLTLVWVDDRGRAAPWPKVLREGLQSHLKEGARP